MKIIQTKSGTQFISKEFQEDMSLLGLRHELAAPYYQEMNGQVEVTEQIL